MQVVKEKCCLTSGNALAVVLYFPFSATTPCMFGKLKYFRRIAARYEKKASHFMEILAFATVLLWVR